MNKNNISNNTIQAVWVAIGSLSSFALGIVSAAILSRYLSKEDYGTYRQILFIYGTLLIVFSAGLPQVFAYFLPRYTLEEGQSVVLKVTYILFFAGAIFSIFLFCFSGLIATILKNPELANGLKWFSPIPLLLLPTLGIEGIFASYQKTIYIAIYNTLTRLIMLIFIVFPIILFNGNYISTIYGWILASSISLIIALYMKKVPFRNVSPRKASLSIKDILNYSIPLVAASISAIAIKTADQFFISRYYGALTFADFANGFIDLPFVVMVTGATTTVLAPVFSNMIFNQAKTDEIIILWKNVIYKSALIIYPINIFIIFNAEYIIKILYSNAYINSIIYFKIAMIANFFNIVVFAPLLLAFKKVKIYSYINIFLAILMWFFGFILVYTNRSALSIAILTVGVGILKIIFFSWYSSRQLNVRWYRMFPFKKLFLITTHSVFIVSIIGAINILIIHFAIFPKLLIDTFLFFIMLLVSARLFRIDYFISIQPLLNRLGIKNNNLS